MQVPAKEDMALPTSSSAGKNYRPEVENFAMKAGDKVGIASLFGSAR
jgi:hypothetical protein